MQKHHNSTSWFCGAHGSSVRIPEGPKIEKSQDFAPGLKFSSDQSQIEIFNRDWQFQANHTARPVFVGNDQGRD